MTGIIIASIIVWIITVAVKGFGIIAITSLISTALFAGRKFGYFCKINTVITWECVGLVLSLIFALVFKNLHLWKFIFVVLLRCIHVGICFYDMNNYVYVKEVIPKDSKEK